MENLVKELQSKKYEKHDETDEMDAMYQVFKIERKELQTETQSLSLANFMVNCRKIREGLEQFQKMYNESVEDIININKQFKMEIKELPEKMELNLPKLPDVLKSKKDKPKKSKK